ncbi:hypothetical protein [Pseudofulvibacter geojedonensis]|uniref:Uncharacterized protein n=1 Tax=Pseudofulvibacter geojedonensis TaxID=1123758 RepID=A0ABW3I3W2_9FLAO
MSLSKDQLQQIDQYLKKKSVQFWDVRYELVDHIACEIEKIINVSNLTFEQAFLEIRKKYDYKTLKEHVKAKGKFVGKIYFKTYGLELKNSIMNPFFLGVNIVIMMLAFYLLNEMSAKASIVPYFIILLVVLVGFIVNFIRYFKVNNKSMLLNLVVSQVMVFCMLPNLLPFVATKEQLRTEYAEENIVFMAIISFFFVVGFKMFLRLFKKQKKYYDLIYS